jgi:recombinational DNA repair ATPase RecF
VNKMLSNLSIHRFRGIHDISINLAGKNIAIIGANGTGKSSVADAIDFLLTGQLRRLTGEGAGALSLSKHAPHVEAAPEEAWVEGTFAGEGVKKPVTLRRTVAKPNDLLTDGPIPEDVHRLLHLANVGSHHMLTRREVLRFIFTEPSKRGDQVGSLLQLTRVDNIRKAVQGASKDAANVLRDRTAVRDTRVQSVFRSFQPPASDWSDALGRVNSHRAQLGGDAVLELTPGSVRVGIATPTIAGADPLQSQRTRELMQQLQTWLERGTSLVSAKTQEYLEAVELLRQNADALKDLQASDLVRAGLTLATGAECPLCLREWDNTDLRAVLAHRLDDARETSASLAGLRQQQASLRSTMVAAETVARSLAEVLGAAEPATAKSCSAYALVLKGAVRELLPDPVADDLAPLVTRRDALSAMRGEEAQNALAKTTARALTLPDLVGTQQLWDELTGMGNALREYGSAVRQRAIAERVAKELLAADKAFIVSRDAVLQSTYDAIAGRFSALYALVHKSDESTFQALLTPTKAGLSLDVDVYNHGVHPPCALHSEGHQDSMGLCLFLTLTEYLAKGPMPLVVLDDVLMSVDRGHRRAVAEMLKKEFAGSQLVITTHDRVWWRQLRTLGLVSGSGSIEFNGWSLEDGPILVPDAGTMLADAQRILAEGNVPGAAHALRRAIETYLPDICDALGATVRFRSDGEWQAGDFHRAAIGRYGELLGKARDAAQSWGDKSEGWGELEASRKSAVSRFNDETWAVNNAIHYNEWADLDPADLQPVVDAYVSLFNLFVCAECGSCMRVTEEGPVLAGMRCDCTKTNWNLIKKKKVATLVS